MQLFGLQSREKQSAFFLLNIKKGSVKLDNVGKGTLQSQMKPSKPDNLKAKH